MTTVKLTVDRNGRVDTIDPEAVQLGPGESVKYKLREPNKKTNWRFMGVQFSAHASDFASVRISADGGTLTLVERSDRKDTHNVEVTLLYTLTDSSYYPAGDIDEANPAPLPVLPVHAYDPLIMSKN